MKAEKIIEKTEPIDIEIGKITLLSIEEYREAEENIKCVNNNWWLRSPGNGDNYAAFVFGKNNKIDVDDGYLDWPFGVRPALNISNLQSLNLKAGDKIKLADHNWTIISDELALALCDEVIGKCAFRECWRREYREEPGENNYQKSDVKKWLEHWAKENGISEEV